MTTTQTRQPAPRATAHSRRWPWWVLGVGTAGILGFAVSAYVPPIMANARVPLQGTGHYVLLVAHIFTATIATVAGAAQFSQSLRRKRPQLHRWLGRAYFFLGVFPSAVLAVPVALLAGFGTANQAGLLMLDALWLWTGINGYRAIRQRRFADHRRWMIRNYGLNIASLASRPFIGIMLAVTLPQSGSAAYHNDALAISHDLSSGSAWLGLFVTMLLVEGYIQRRYGVPAARARARRPVTEEL